MEDYDFLQNTSDELKLVRFEGLHVCTTWRKWIFDANYSYALPLTKKWLDKVACIGLAATHANGYKNLIREAYFFQPSGSVLKNLPSNI